MPRAIAGAFGVLLLMASGANGAPPSEERQALLLHQLKHDCGSCHGMTMKGGLGPPLRPAALEGKSDDVLVEVILRGLPGTPMPPWAFEISQSEAYWLVRRLREGDIGGR